MNHIFHYFAYGSNMNTRRVAERGLQVVDAVGARLEGYALEFNKMSREHAGVGHANIVYTPGSRTEGVLYELAHADEILKMDPFERAPWNYGREVIAVQHEHGATWAWTYFANPAVLRPGLRPPIEYLDHLIAGGEFLSTEYLEQLLIWRQELVGP